MRRQRRGGGPTKALVLALLLGATACVWGLQVDHAQVDTDVTEGFQLADAFADTPSKNATELLDEVVVPAALESEVPPSGFPTTSSKHKKGNRLIEQPFGGALVAVEAAALLVGGATIVALVVAKVKARAAASQYSYEEGACMIKNFHRGQAALPATKYYMHFEFTTRRIRGSDAAVSLFDFKLSRLKATLQFWYTMSANPSMSCCRMNAARCSASRTIAGSFTPAESSCINSGVSSTCTASRSTTSSALSIDGAWSGAPVSSNSALIGNILQHSTALRICGSVNCLAFREKNTLVLRSARNDLIMSGGPVYECNTRTGGRRPPLRSTPSKSSNSLP
ncbi:unnamed protein product [Phytophthora lilii]|uniref:Unnamed protein product n=1 Tax=Phytophthora lilii TaxID=2077276 RepID=A0A9W6TPA6_9STRA|nr:unnamed protein product [Phytophthora lilii]